MDASQPPPGIEPPFSAEQTGEDFYAEPLARTIHRAFAHHVLQFPGVTARVTKSQVPFRAQRAFAWTWRPGQYTSSVIPIVISVALPQRLISERIKEIVEPRPNLWMHHLEITAPEQVDEELLDWAELAYEWAQRPAGR